MNCERWLRIQNKHKCLPPLGSSSAAALPACANPGARGMVRKQPFEKKREGKHSLRTPKNSFGFSDYFITESSPGGSPGLFLHPQNIMPTGATWFP